ncbi:cyclic AMP response element-binding protein B-like [Solea solea]|uniref:cyclic AMP response element-binding protein B-like n=1 Tax=Solea solea TaxID=90069 RepID=UPI00272DABAC|nr:cyclic AMP response element-binding protein B-like [Solea solea]
MSAGIGSSSPATLIWRSQMKEKFLLKDKHHSSLGCWLWQQLSQRGDSEPLGKRCGKHSMAVTGDETETAPEDDQRQNPSSSIPHGVGDNNVSHYSIALSELRKRKVCSIKKRIFAQTCQRIKKEYVKKLEERVAILRHQNRILTKELRALRKKQKDAKNNTMATLKCDNKMARNGWNMDLETSF